MKKQANPGRTLEIDYKGKKYQRIPIDTHFIEIGENLTEIVNQYTQENIEEGDFVCVSTKIVSICTPGLTVHKDNVKISPLAKLIVKFVKKWPNDIGYSSPRKMQVAINRAGYPRIIFAIIGGLFMKLIGKPGYFYKLAGNQINAIDGFTIGYTDKPLFANYAFLPPRPKEANLICNEIEKAISAPVIMLDGNNVDNHVVGMSNTAETLYSKEDLKHILHGNPQGQEGDGRNTPILVIHEVKN